MNNLKEFLNWNNIAIIITLLGFVGTIFGLIQGKRRKDEQKIYDHLFNIAKQNMDMSDKTAKLKNYELKIKNMQNEIEDRIPVEAKKIALKELLASETKQLENSYSQVLMINNQLSELDEKTSLNNELINDVIKTIEPSYTQNKSYTLFNMVFYAASLFSSISAFAIPYNIYKIFSVIIFIFQLFFILRMIFIYVKNNYKKEDIHRISHKYIIIISNLLLWFSFITSLFLMFSNNYNSEKIIAYPIIVAFIIHIILDFVFYKKETRKENKKRISVIFVANIIIVFCIIVIILGIEFSDTLLGISFCIILISIVSEFIVSLNILFSYSNHKKHITKYNIKKLLKKHK